MNKFSGRLMKSVIVDDTENVGDPADGDIRSLPMYMER